MYHALVSCIVRFSHRSCEAFFRFSFLSFAFFARLRLVRVVRLCDPGSVPVPTNPGSFKITYIVCVFRSFCLCVSVVRFSFSVHLRFVRVIGSFVSCIVRFARQFN